MTETPQSPLTPDDPLDAAFAEYLRRVDAGQRPELEAFLEEFPSTLRPTLRHAIEDDQRAQDLTGSHYVDAPVGPRDPDATPTWNSAAGSPVETVDLSTGSFVIGDYELLELIGRGGMGVVYRARQRSLDRIVAVKMILGGRLAAPEDVVRFVTEAQAASRVDHPNIVAIYQVGEFEGRHYFSMDYVEGTDLARLCAEGPLPPRRAAAYLSAVADAVHAAHEQGILHRDLKPANILIDRDDRPLVTDFGLAKYISVDRGLTATGRAMGTPAYMPPEQASGAWSEVTPASDVYSLGAILYVMLTGHPPFRGRTEVDTLLEVVHREPASPLELQPNADPELATICLKCLQKDPAERYASAQELADELNRYLRGEPIQARPQSSWQRTWRWMLDIPIVAALAGRHVPLPTEAHRRAQAGIILSVITLVVVLVLSLRFGQTPLSVMPDRIMIAAGRPDGLYHAVSQRIQGPLANRAGRGVDIAATSGSLDNQAELLSGRAHLGWLQAAALRGDELCVVAPAYYEFVHVIVRRDSGIETMADLAGHTICLGEAQSGSRLTAEAILTHLGLRKRVQVRDHDWAGFAVDRECQAGIFTVGLNPPGLDALFESGEYRLVPLEVPDDFPDRTLEAAHIASGYYPRAIPAGASLATLRTPAFLVTSRTMPDRLVAAALEALYGLNLPGLIPREAAASWTFLPWHPAARAFYAKDPAPPTKL